MVPSHSGILAEAINIASTSLQQRQSTSLASFLQSPHFRNSRPELFCKKGALKNLAKFTGVYSSTSVSCKFWEILNKTFFQRILPMTASGICANRDFPF